MSTQQRRNTNHTLESKVAKLETVVERLAGTVDHLVDKLDKISTPKWQNIIGWVGVIGLGFGWLWTQMYNTKAETDLLIKANAYKIDSVENQQVATTTELRLASEKIKNLEDQRDKIFDIIVNRFFQELITENGN